MMYWLLSSTSNPFDGENSGSSKSCPLDVQRLFNTSKSWFANLFSFPFECEKGDEKYGVEAEGVPRVFPSTWEISCDGSGAFEGTVSAGLDWWDFRISWDNR